MIQIKLLKQKILNVNICYWTSLCSNHLVLAANRHCRVSAVSGSKTSSVKDSLDWHSVHLFVSVSFAFAVEMPPGGKCLQHISSILSLLILLCYPVALNTLESASYLFWHVLFSSFSIPSSVCSFASATPSWRNSMTNKNDDLEVWV